MQAAFEQSPGLDLLLRWRLVSVGVSPAGEESAIALREALATSWLRWLRQEFGTDSPAAWSLSVDVVPGGAVGGIDGPQDGSLLADFLAAIDEAEESHEELPLAGLVPEGCATRPRRIFCTSRTRRQRRRLLRQVRRWDSICSVPRSPRHEDSRHHDRRLWRLDRPRASGTG